MYKKVYYLLLSLLFLTVGYSQELNAVVSVNYDRIGNSQQAYFKNLESTLKEFINNTSWSSRNYTKQERIDCVFIFNVTGFTNNVVSGSLQVQATRPVFNTNYFSPILNVNDRDVVFTFNEFETLSYNINSFDSNLTSIIAFYANVIIALDQFTFANVETDIGLERANTVLNTAQQSSYRGWKQGEGTNSRYALINELNQGSSIPFYKTLYSFHREGLDNLEQDEAVAREGLYRALVYLEELSRSKQNGYLLRVFFDAKTDEIVNLYLGNNDSNKKKIITILNRLSPLNSSKWNSM